MVDSVMEWWWTDWESACLQWTDTFDLGSTDFADGCTLLMCGRDPATGILQIIVDETAARLAVESDAGAWLHDQISRTVYQAQHRTHPVRIPLPRRLRRLRQRRPVSA